MPTPFIPALPGTIRGPFQNSEPRTHFMVRTHTESWIPVMAYDRESEAACQRRAQEITNKITQEQPSKMPHREATNYFQHEYQAVRYYRTYGSDEAEVQRKIRDGEITIGEPPEKLGAIRRAPGGHFHYEFPDVPAPDKTEAQLRALNRPKPRFQMETDEWGDDTDPKVLAKSKLTPLVISTNGASEKCADCGVAPGKVHKPTCEGGLHLLKVASDTPMLAFLRPKTLIHLPPGAFKASGTNVSTRIIEILK